MRSPKNKYHVEVYFEKPLKNIGSVVSFTTNDINDINEIIKAYHMHGEKRVNVVIKENKKTYPAFKWEVISSYYLSLCL